MYVFIFTYYIFIVGALKTMVSLVGIDSYTDLFVHRHNKCMVSSERYVKDYF